MPFSGVTEEARVRFHTELVQRFLEGGTAIQVHAQVPDAAGPNTMYWLDGLQIGGFFGQRGGAIAQAIGLNPSAALNDLQEVGGRLHCLFYSGPRPEVDDEVRLTVIISCDAGHRGRVMREEGTDHVWYGHRGGLGGGGAGGMPTEDFHLILPTLPAFVEQHHPEYTAEFPGWVFETEFRSDDFIRTNYPPQAVIPISPVDDEMFLRRLAAYVHQCGILRRLQAQGAFPPHGA